MMLAIKVSMKITTLLLLTGFVAASTPAFAQDEVKSDLKEEGAPRIQINIPQATRPSALPAMYVSLAGLQAYDGYSTLRGVRAGATEANPLVGGLAGQPAAFWTVKALSTVTTIYFAEQLWRQHKRGQAIMTMVVANAVMGAVAAHNMSVVRAR
jgi:Domain of unknown function (DUF5658)